MTRFLAFFLTALLTLSAFPGTGAAQGGLSLDSIRIGTHPEKTRIVMELSQVTDFRAFYLPGPPRIVIDMPHFAWRGAAPAFPPGSLVKAVRQGTLEPGISRLVYELDAAVSIGNVFILPRAAAQPDRLVLDFTRAPDAAAAAQQRSYGNLNRSGAGKTDAPVQTSQTTTATQVATAPLPVPPPAPARPANAKKPLIVIDPGHGGQDPGAIGAGGYKEKDVTLAIARELKDSLEKTGRYRVALTRTKDVFIKLQDRVKVARDLNADLFISLHADSIDKPSVSGASIYTLSNTASDAQTEKLAARENRADLIAGVDLSHEDKQVANILIDLAMRDTMNQSKFFANTVVTKIKGSGIRMLESPHRYAGFAVLKAPDVPSVLIEIGFMSNKKEVTQLTSPAHRQKIAHAIRSGIDVYFDRIEKNGRE